MGATDLPLDVRQRIESRWSAQMKRLQQQRDPEGDASRPPGGDPDDRSLVDLANWGKQRPGDR